MATLFSANGGSVSVKPSGGALATFDVTEWRLQEANIIADTTTSAAAYTTGQGTIENHSFSFSLPVDSANKPETAIPPGVNLTIWFKVGSLAAWHKIINAVIESVSPVNNNAGDVFRVDVSGRCGSLTAYSAVTPA